MDREELFARAVRNSIPSDKNTGSFLRIAERRISAQPLGDHGAIVQDMPVRGVSVESVARFAKIVG